MLFSSMRFLIYYFTCALLAPATVAASIVVDDSEALIQLDNLAQRARDNQLASLPDGTSEEQGDQTCTKSNTLVRKEWGDLTGAERIAYTDAVLCLQSKASLSPKALVPGARSRFDDFVGIHINQTVFIHFTGTFLSWHRYFTWYYEQALINECGYTGTQPYWNWGRYSSDPASSPVFDGSATSMSGDGKVSKSGKGGGCVTSGPFKNMTVNLGPVPLPFSGTTQINGTGLRYNPRCLRRKISAKINQNSANATSIVNLINQNQDIWDFEMKMQLSQSSKDIGVHLGGHYTFGFDPGADPFASPGDPVFYLHHAMIDRVWWIWQNQDPSTRTNALSGTGTLGNSPKSPNTTLETIINLGFAGSSPITVGELMNTTSGPFCYTYQ